MPVLMTIGGVPFFSPVKDQVTPSFDNFERTSEYTWPSQQRLTRKPAHQFTGIGENTIAISGVLYPHMFGGLETMNALRALAAQGNPVPLQRHMTTRGTTIGGGNYAAHWQGMFAITRIQTLDKVINSEGYPIRLDFSLELVEYGDDRSYLMGA